MTSQRFPDVFKCRGSRPGISGRRQPINMYSDEFGSNLTKSSWCPMGAR